MLIVTLQVATAGAESAVNDCLVYQVLSSTFVSVTVVRMQSLSTIATKRLWTLIYFLGRPFCSDFAV